MYDFSDKAAFITGATRGIGAALAREFACQGAKICVVGRDGDLAHKLALEVRREFGVDAFGRACDVRDATRVDAIADEAVRRFGGIDICVNNAAALGQLTPVRECEPHSWSTVIDTNLNGSFYVSRACIRRTPPGKTARLIFISSSVGREVRLNWGAYAVSKWAIEGLMKLIAAERASSSVVAFSVNPGGTATRMRREAFPDEDQSKLPDPARIAAAFVKIMRQNDDALNGRAFNARDYL